MEVEVVLRALDDPQWSSFVSGHPVALPFHHPAWAALLAECYGFRAFCLTFEHGGRTVAGVPLIEVARHRGRPKWVSLPFTDSCPPLTTDTADIDLVGSLEHTRRAFAVGRMEIRDQLPGLADRADAAFVTHRLDLARPEDEIFSTFHASQVRRNIRRAEKAGVQVRVGSTEAELTSIFYRLHLRTRRRLGVPIQPLRYFRLLWRRFLQPGMGVVMIAETDGVPVAAAVFLASRGTCVYKYGASDERSWGLRPNHVLFWEAIRWACARGCQTFDFGRTGPADRGLRQFKSHWGTVERPLSYSILSDTPVRHRDRDVPAPIRSVIRRAPLFVPRVLGELLYRRTA